MVEVAGGAGPDILDLDGPTDVVEFANAGKAIDLSDYSKQYGWEDILYDWAYGASCYQGKLYSLPAGFEGMGMYYNMDVMNEHGWSIPKNLDELETLMANIKEAGLIPLSFGNSNYQGQVDHLYSTILSTYSGPETVKEAINGDIKFDDPEMVKSIDLLKKWWDEGYIMDQASQSATTDDEIAFLGDGRAVMAISGTWMGNQLVQSYPDCNWNFELMPVLNDSVGSIFPLAVGESYVINGNSKNADICAAILNFLYTDMDTFYAAVNGGALQPFPIDAFDVNKLEGLDEKVLNMNKVMVDSSAAGNIGYCAWTFWPADARTYMNENFDAVLLDQITSKEYMAGAQEYIDAAIADGSTPVLP
jgi:raffinose/stachyose/melibiose transport system substrate-binding protein